MPGPLYPEMGFNDPDADVGDVAEQSDVLQECRGAQLAHDAMKGRRIGEAACPGPGKGRKEVVKFETCNVTSAYSLWEHLKQTDAHIVLAQETKIVSSAVVGAKAKAMQLGWKSTWAAARTTERDGVSGGVAIFARKGLALWLPPGDSGVIEDHRAAWAWVAGDGIPRVAAYSLYLRDGQGPSDLNLESMR